MARLVAERYPIKRPRVPHPSEPHYTNVVNLLAWLDESQRRKERARVIFTSVGSTEDLEEAVSTLTPPKSPTRKPRSSDKNNPYVSARGW